LRSCVFINSNPSDRAIFVTALFDTSPSTVCFVADDGDEALDIMRKERIVPSYIFVELSMPGIDGIRFLKNIKRIRSLRRAAVIVHCKSPDAVIVDIMKEHGAFAIYPAPYNYRGMCNILRAYLNHDPIRLSLN